MRANYLIVCLILVAVFEIVSTGCSSENRLLEPIDVRPITRTDHPTQMALIGFVQGGLSATERAAVAQHLRTCEPCDDFVATVETAGEGKKFRD